MPTASVRLTRCGVRDIREDTVGLPRSKDQEAPSETSLAMPLRVTRALPCVRVGRCGLGVWAGSCSDKAPHLPSPQRLTCEALRGRTLGSRFNWIFTWI